MNPNFQQLIKVLQQKNISVHEYLDYLNYLQTAYPVVTSKLKQQKISLPHYHSFLSDSKQQIESIISEETPQESNRETVEILNQIGLTLLHESKISLEELNQILRGYRAETLNLKEIMQHLFQHRKISAEEFVAFIQGNYKTIENESFYQLNVSSETIQFSIAQKGLKRFGPYEVLEELGRGGMGVVYKAYHPKLNQMVALKVLLPGKNSSESLVKRFIREAQIMAKLNCSSIVQIYDYGEEEGKPYLAMEFVAGKSLDQCYSTLSLREKLKLIQKIAEALTVAHSSGILHRDIKLQNILVLEEHSQFLPKLTDFGLAKEVNLTRESAKLTQTGALLGTPQYMAPEQVKGDIQNLDERTDLYAIGTCLYHIITNKLPYQGTSLKQLLNKILNEEALPPSKYNKAIHKDIDAIVLKSIEKEPLNRYQTTKELALDIERFLQGYPVLAALPSPKEKALKWFKRNRFQFVLLSVLLLVLLLFPAFLLWFDYKSKEKELNELYQKANTELINGKENKQRDESLSSFLNAFSSLNQLLEMRQTTIGEKLKWETGKLLLEIAYQKNKHYLAAYLVAELNRLSFPQKAEKKELVRHLEKEQSKILKQHKSRVIYWCETLKTKPFHPFYAEEAFFEITKMIEQEISSMIFDEVKKGNLYLLKYKYKHPEERTALGWYYTKMIKILGRLEPKNLEEELIKSLEYFSLKLKKKKGKRALEQITYMVYLSRAMVYLKQVSYMERFELVRWRMGHGSLFWERTSSLFKKGLAFKLSAKPQQSEQSDKFSYYMKKGREQFELGKFKESIVFYTKAISLKPNDSSIYNNRGNSKVQLGNFEEGFADFTRAISLAPDDTTGYINRGGAKYKKGDYNGALSDYTTAIKLNPKNVLAFYNRARAKKNLGDEEGAFLDCNEAIRLDPQYAIAYMNRGLWKHQNGNLKEAIKDLSESIHLNPKYTMAYVNRGLVRVDMGELTKAIADYDRAIELKPQNIKAYIHRGYARSKKGDLKGAIFDFNEAIRLEPQNPEGYNSRAYAKKQAGDLTGAIKDYSEGIRLAPNNAKSYNYRGVAKMNKGDFDGAIRDQNKAISLDPNLNLAYNNRGLAKFQKGDLKGALADYNKAILLNPKDPISHINRAEVKAKNGNFREAILDYNKAIFLRPKRVETYNSRGFLKFSRGDSKGAIADFNKAIQLNPNKPSSYVNRGGALFKEGDPKGAIADFNKAIQLNSNYVKAYYNRGAVQYKQGQKKKAILDFKTYLKLTKNTEDPQLRQERKQLLKVFPNLKETKE